MTDLEVRGFPSKEAFRDWLDGAHADCPGIWLLIAKKGTGVPSVTYAEAVEVALCYGWIDGQSARHDETYYRQRLTPRRPRSIWSKINRTKVEALTAAGQMRPAGLRQVEAAQADGRWDAAYDGQRTATVPPDLQAALDADPAAATAFASLDATNRYAVLHRVQTAASPQTRARRIATHVARLAAGDKPHP